MIKLVEQPKADVMGLYNALKDMGAPVILRPDGDGRVQSGPQLRHASRVDQPRLRRLPPVNPTPSGLTIKSSCCYCGGEIYLCLKGFHSRTVRD